MNTDHCQNLKCPPSLWVCDCVENVEVLEVEAEVVEMVAVVHRTMNYHSAFA